MATQESFIELNNKVLSLQKQLDTKSKAYDELNFLHESMMEHSTGLENELQETNEKVNSFLNQMKKYLSPQLFELITGSSNSDEKISFERKRLTVFFSDIVGFTDITDSVDPEVLSDCLNVYLDEMSQIAVKYGATVDKFIGDAIMIFFGAPKFENDEKHAVDCVSMAIEMMNKVVDVNVYWKKSGIASPLKIRVGINTGFCTVGNFGSQERTDYTIIGGAVNLASRLESSAKAGTIVVSDSTKMLIENVIKTEKMGDITVKGIHKPVTIHQVIGKRTRDGGATTMNPFISVREDGFVIPYIEYSKSEKVESIDKIEQALELALREIKSNKEVEQNHIIT